MTEQKTELELQQEIVENMTKRFWKLKEKQTQKTEKLTDEWSLANDPRMPVLGVGVGLSAGVLLGYLKYLNNCGGNFNKVANVKEYFLNNPDAFEQAKEALHSTDLNYISGYVMGEDGLATALWQSTGLYDFFRSAGIDAFQTGLVSGAVIGSLPVVAYFLRKKILKAQLKSLKNQQVKLVKDIREEKAKLNEMKTKQEQKVLNKNENEFTR